MRGILQEKIEVKSEVIRKSKLTKYQRINRAEQIRILCHETQKKEYYVVIVANLKRHSLRRRQTADIFY